LVLELLLHCRKEEIKLKKDKKNTALFPIEFKLYFGCNYTKKQKV
jgi:hypothetical protein